MPNPSVQPSLAALTNKVKGSLILSQEASAFYQKRRGKIQRIAQSKVYLITELAFLQLFLAWEDFLEETFIRYMCGGKTESGYSPRLRLEAQNMNHALELLKGSRQYVDWVESREIQNRARIFFEEGGPYQSAIDGAITELNHLKIIRNRIAHRSKSAEHQFDELTRQQLLGYRPKGLTPGLLLRIKLPPPKAREIKPKIQEVKKMLDTMGFKKRRGTPTFLDEYGSLIFSLGQMIVP